LPARVVRFDVSPQIDIPAGKFESFKWDVLPAQPNCRLTGHLEVVDGGNRDVQVFVLGDDDFANLVNGHGARAFFQTEKTTAVTLDVRTKAVGRMVLAISNAFSSVTAKRVELRGLLVTCR
jgi:hypothetical protein